jgi:hypothetical protein
MDSALKTLRQNWESTRAVWNDPVSWNFEKEYWVPLEAQIQATQREMEQLAQVIASARQNVK